MKCMLCESLSFTHICPSCQKSFLAPSLYKRKIQNNINVFSFYKYKEIKDLLHTKHTDLGYYIYTILAKNSFKKFASEFKFPHAPKQNDKYSLSAVASVAIDDSIQSGYSHTAILNKALKSSYIVPHFNKLRATNHVSYSGKSKEFRVLNPRDLVFKSSKEGDYILIDDIITTGTTLQEACVVLQKAGKNVLFCLTLADASL